MPVDEGYRRQVALLVKAVPLIAAETAFALKGGTAINLSLRDMPRLSVDIDLTYIPVSDRASSLNEIDAAMRRIAKEIERGVPGARVSASAPKGEKCITKLIVRADDAQIKLSKLLTWNREHLAFVNFDVAQPEVRTLETQVPSNQLRAPRLHTVCLLPSFVRHTGMN